MRQNRLLCLGLDHHSSSVALREQPLCTLDSLGRVFAQPHPPDPIREYALLSTCNRFELYAAVDGRASVRDGERALYDLLAATSERPAGELAVMPFTRRTDIDVMRHLAAVAAGLHSQVLGEAQILGQVATAYQDAVAAGSMGPLLDATMLAALHAGKRVRRETTIGNRPASISSVAVALAQRSPGGLSGKRVAVIGLGEMGRLLLKALAGRHVAAINLVNRTPEKAATLAPADCVVYSLDQLEDALTAVDVAFCATGSDGFILTAPQVERLQVRRKQRPLTLIDIALPRDVDPAAGRTPGIRLYTLDELHAELDDAVAARRREVPRALAIIDEEVAAFEDRLLELAMRPVVADFRRQAERIRREQLARTMHFLGDEVDEEVAAQFEHLSRSLVNRLLHAPTNRLRAAAGEAEAEAYAATIRELFEI